MTAAARESRSRRSFFFIGKSLCVLGKTAFEEAGGGSPDRPRMNARGIADGRLIYPAAIPELDRDFDHLVRSRSRSHRPPVDRKSPRLNSRHKWPSRMPPCA